MASSRVRAVWLAAESTYGSDPDSDGSDYAALRVDGEPDPQDGTEIEDVGNDSGRNEPPELVITRSGAKLDLAIPLYGYATTSGDGDSAPTADALDLVLANAFGAAIQATGGEGVNSGSSSSDLVLDTSLSGAAIGDLFPVYLGASDTPARVVWRRVSTIVGAPTYGITPNHTTTPTTAAVLLGARGYGQADDLQTATTGLACVVEIDGTLHRLLGGRVMSMSLDAVAGKVPRLNASLMFDSWESGVSMASLPAITTFPAPMVQRLAPFAFNGTVYPTKSIKIDFGIKAQPIESTSGSNARTGITTVAIDPVVSVEFAWAPGTWNAAFSAGTVGVIVAQCGGAYGSSRGNSAGFSALRAQVQSAPKAVSDGGYMRNAVEFRVLGSGGAGLRRWEFARC